MSTAEQPKLDSRLPRPARSARRKRFLAISVAALAVLSVAMGVSFLGTTGTTGVEVKASGSSDFVFPVTAETGKGISGITPGVEKVVTELEFGSTKAAGKLPGLGEPTVNTPGEVAKSGDLALVDASTESLGSAPELIVNVYITNLGALGLDYSSFALPVTVYKATCTETAEEKCGEAKAKWALDTKVSAEAASIYLTNTEGMLSFRVEAKAHQYLDIAMNNGGSYYLSKEASGGALGPDFYFTAQPV